MTYMNQMHNDEIDLFNLLEILWLGKWLIIAFATISLLLGSGYLLLQESKYESKISIMTDIQPPFYSKEKIITDFENLIFSQTSFEDWKKNNPKSSLILEHISKTQLFDGIEFSKNTYDLQILLKQDKGSNGFFLLRSAKPEMLDDFFKYSNYIIRLANERHLDRAKYQLSLMEARSKDLISLKTSNNLIQTVVELDLFISSIESGGNVLMVSPPTYPQKVYPKSKAILGISIILGGLLGIIYVFALNKIKKQKELPTQ